MFIDLMEDYWIKNILGNDEYTKPLEVITENVLRLPKGILKNQIIIKGQEYPLKKATYKEKDVRADVYAFLGEDTILNLEAYKTFDKEGKCTNSQIVATLNYILNEKKLPDIINMSFSVLSISSSVTRDSLTRNLISKGVTIITSAGNNAVNAKFYYPANISEVITVSSSD